MPSGCSVRAIWILNNLDAVAFSRRFPVVEKRWRTACKTNNENSDKVFSSLPTDSDLADAFLQRKLREGSARGFGIRKSNSTLGSDSWVDDPITRHIIGLYINKELEDDKNILWPLILHIRGHYSVLVLPMVEPRHVKAYEKLCKRPECGTSLGLDDGLSSLLLELPAITGAFMIAHAIGDIISGDIVEPEVIIAAAPSVGGLFDSLTGSIGISSRAKPVSPQVASSSPMGTASQGSVTADTPKMGSRPLDKDALRTFISSSMPFGTPLDLNYSNIFTIKANGFSASDLAPTYQKQPAWKPYLFKGKQRMLFTTHEIVHAALYDRDEIPDNISVSGQINCRADLGQVCRRGTCHNQHMIKAKIEQLKLMGLVILSGIMKSLDSYSTLEADASAREVKTYAFQAIGLLAQRMPHLFSKKIDMAARLFNALKVESQSLRFVVQEATISLAAAYKVAPLAVLQDLEVLLLKNSQVEESEVRFCAVRWATSLFDFQHCPSRFICMLGSADAKLDIREMALKGLCLLKNGNQIDDFKYPKLGVMLDYIIRQQPKLLESTNIRDQNLHFPSNTYVAMIKFLMKCFQSKLEKNKTLEGSPEFISSVKTFCLLLEHSMSFEGSVELHVTSSKALLIIGSHMPEVVASHYALKVSWLKQLLLNHVDWDTRESIACLLGIVSSALPLPATSDVISELTSIFSQTHKPRFETQHGALCAIGYITADYLSRALMPEMFLRKTLRCLVDVVNSETSALAAVAMQALGHIGLRISLPPLEDSNSDGILIVLYDKLSKFLLSDDVKAIQKIVISIGHICVKESSSSHIDTTLNLIFSLCRSKAEDVLFAAGEALSFLWGSVSVSADTILRTNFTSLSTASNFLMGDLNSSETKQFPNGQSEHNEEYHASARDAIIKKLFDVLLYSSRKEERCAGTVWLVSLTKYCGSHPIIQKMLPEIQEAFSHLLAEQNELTKELASQGMSIVYDLGDESMKQNLVNALVNTLTGSGKRKRAIKLVEDSEVFQDGSLGETASGGKLNTYKELCSLANEMGQPDLIYKFMDLANHQASLNSKRAAAFGFSKIAKQAGDALKPHLRSLIPRLVRYQYDPGKNVQVAH